jgi:hypothetical protein
MHRNPQRLWQQTSFVARPLAWRAHVDSFPLDPLGEFLGHHPLDGRYRPNAENATSVTCGILPPT